jgi:hypothetical protein
MKDPTNMTDKELAVAIANRIVDNLCEAETAFSHGTAWTLEEWVVDTLLNGHKAKPLYEMTREELLVLWVDSNKEDEA